MAPRTPPFPRGEGRGGIRVPKALASSVAALTGIQFYGYTVNMKATVDVPDDLYRRVKAKSALEGRAVREVTIELYRRWLREEAEVERSPREWLENWVRLGDELLRDAPAAPTGREILEEDRNRLEPR